MEVQYRGRPTEEDLKESAHRKELMDKYEATFKKFLDEGDELKGETIGDVSYESWVPTRGVMRFPGGTLSVEDLRKAYGAVVKKPISHEAMVALLQGSGEFSLIHAYTIVQG